MQWAAKRLSEADIVDQVHQHLDVHLIEAAAGIASRGGVGNALGIQLHLVMWPQFEVFQARADGRTPPAIARFAPTATANAATVLHDPSSRTSADIFTPRRPRKQDGVYRTVTVNRSPERGLQTRAATCPPAPFGWDGGCRPPSHREDWQLVKGRGKSTPSGKCSQRADRQVLTLTVVNAEVGKTDQVRDHGL